MSSSDWSPNFGHVSATPPNWPAKRPLRIALLGDFSASALRGRVDIGEALAKRKPVRVEFDTLDDALERSQLTLPLPVGAEGAMVEVAVSELDGFHPDSLYRELGMFAALASLRKRLNQPTTYAAAAAEVMEWADAPKISAGQLAASQRSRGGGLDAGASLGDFARLTGRKPGKAREEADIDTLLRNIVGPFVVPADSPDKTKLIAAVDRALSDAMRAVLHQPEFQNAESLWRGVDFLVRRLETGPQLQVHLIDINAEELAADLSAQDDLSDSGLYKLLVERPSEDPDGGYTYLVGLYQFDASPPQAELLGRMAQVAACAGAPFIGAVATDVFTDRREPPHRLIQEAFQALRALPASSWLALMGPRFLLRHPYGKRSDPISTFSFEEFTPRSGFRGLLWGHPALLALCVLAVPGGQLTIDDLPFHHFVDRDGDQIALPCTERLINLQAAQLLRDWGITGVLAHKGEPLVRLNGLEALNGDGLASALVGKRNATPGARVLLQGKIDTQGAAKAGWAPASRTAGAPAVAKPPAAPAAAERAAEASAEAPASSDSDTDAELAALLAGLDAPAAGEPAAAAPAAAAAPEPAAEAAAEPPVDDELAALLASLGGDSTPAPEAPAGDAPAPADDDGMDPELAAMLKALS